MAKNPHLDEKEQQELAEMERRAAERKKLPRRPPAPGEDSLGGRDGKWTGEGFDESFEIVPAKKP